MDLIQREGHYPPPAGSSTILGVEFSGLVAEIGSGVSSWKLDDEVLGLAGGVKPTSRFSAAQLIKTSISNRVPMPSTLFYRTRTLYGSQHTFLGPKQLVFRKTILQVRREQVALYGYVF